MNLRFKNSTVYLKFNSLLTIKDQFKKISKFEARFVFVDGMECFQ